MRCVSLLLIGLVTACSGPEVELVVRESVYVEIVETWMEVQGMRQMAQQVRADDKQLEALQEAIVVASGGALDGEIDLDEAGLFVTTIRDVLRDDGVEASEVTRTCDTLRTVYDTKGPREFLVQSP